MTLVGLTALSDDVNRTLFAPCNVAASMMFCVQHDVDTPHLVAQRLAVAQVAEEELDRRIVRIFFRQKKEFALVVIESDDFGWC